MSSTAAPARAAAAFYSAISILNGIGTLWIFALMVLINVDIVGRAVFGSPVRGVPEIVRLSIVGIVFLQVAHSLHVGRFTRSDSMIGWLGRRWPVACHGLLVLFHLTGCVLLALLFAASLPLFERAWRIADYVGAVGHFTAPTWPVRLTILVGSAATAVEFLLLALQDIRNLLGARRERD